MNTSINKISLYLAGIILILISSCKEDFLDRKPQGTVFTEGLQTQKGIDALLIGAYSLMDGQGSYAGWPGESYAASVTNWAWNTASDNAYKGTTLGDEAPIGRIERYIHQPTNSKLVHKWQVMYDGVSRANDALNALEKGGQELSENEANEIEGQAKFLRAWFHFRLQQMHWQIPYITHDVEDATQVPNDSKVWDQIEQDLQFAVENLPNSFEGEPGRADKFAAMAVKAYVHMFQQEWEDAATLLDGIINSNNFELADSYYDNFNIAGENNKESIFEIQYAVNEGTWGGLNGGADHWTTNPNNPFTPTCCGMYQPSQDLVNAYEVDDEGLPLLGISGPKYNDSNLKNDMGVASDEEFVPTDEPVDPRLDWVVGRRGIPFLDWGVHTGQEWIRDQSHGGPYNTKIFMFEQAEMSDYSHDAFSRANAINFRAYRYAHVLLWRAECAVELDDLPTALEYVNQVRRRADNDVVMGKVNTTTFDGREVDVNWDEPAANYQVDEYSSFPSQDFARKAVHMELRLETALDGRRFFNLVRWGRADEVLNEYIDNDSEFRSFMEGTSFNPDKHDHFPLPQDQVDLQEGVLEQDPDW